ncbi:MAG: hypothetical protein U5N55_11785 [Cypionkella sp.]|nr:hypothetical protein [Cypionkella sp.]
MSVTGEISLVIRAKQTGTADLWQSDFVQVATIDMEPFKGGNGAIGTADVLFKDTRTIAASGNDDLDLAGVLSDAFGATITAAEIIAVYVRAESANTNDVVIGNVSNGFYARSAWRNGNLCGIA